MSLQCSAKTWATKFHSNIWAELLTIAFPGQHGAFSGNDWGVNHLQLSLQDLNFDIRVSWKESAVWRSWGFKLRARRIQPTSQNQWSDYRDKDMIPPERIGMAWDGHFGATRVIMCRQEEKLERAHQSLQDTEGFPKHQVLLEDRGSTGSTEWLQTFRCLYKLELFLFLCGNWTEQSERYFEQNYPLQDFEEMLQNFRLSTKEFQECSDDVVT